ncbi:MAG: iron-sulfur cluster insertion protein ErpA [Chloroflexi bacterium]|nr:iron-sulfur cluster insertion protein ErpA [Chloroflexota bacterium]
MVLEHIETQQITLTPAAAQAVIDLLQKRNLQNYGLRVFISGGGCSGYQYGMALEDNIRETDLVSEMHGVKLIIDEVSINYLTGASIDYVDGLMGSGFKIENPNAVSACGCGNSFRAKDSPGGEAGGCSCG